MATKVTILGMDEPKDYKKIEFKVWVEADGTTTPNKANHLQPHECDEVVLLRRKYRGGDYDFLSAKILSDCYFVLGHFNDGIV
jgi:hypothetical protein